MPGPGKYKDIAKAANDLLNDSYQYNNKVKLKTKSTTGVTFTTEGVLTGRGVSGKIGSSFKAYEGINVDKLQYTTDGRVVVESSLANAIEGFKFKVTAEDGSSVGASGKEYKPQGTISAEYGSDSLSFLGKVDVTNGPSLYASTLASYDGVLFGGEVKYNTDFDGSGSGTLQDFGGAIGYKASDYSVVLKSAKKTSQLNLAVHHILSPEYAFGAVASYARDSGKTALDVGGTYKVDGANELQGKVNSSGIVSGNWITKVSPSVKLTASASFDATDLGGSNGKFGLSFVLG